LGHSGEVCPKTRSTQSRTKAAQIILSLIPCSLLRVVHYGYFFIIFYYLTTILARILFPRAIIFEVRRATLITENFLMFCHTHNLPSKHLILEKAHLPLRSDSGIPVRLILLLGQVT
jgi:hypothetical protein